MHHRNFQQQKAKNESQGVKINDLMQILKYSTQLPYHIPLTPCRNKERQNVHLRRQIEEKTLTHQRITEVNGRSHDDIKDLSAHIEVLAEINKEVRMPLKLLIYLV